MKKKEKKVKEKKVKNDAVDTAEKDITPEAAAEKEAFKSLIVKCVAVILCAVIVSISISSAFDKIAEAVKATGSVVVATGNGSAVASDPSDVSSDVSTDTPADVPADTPVDVPADTPADVPADTPADTPTAGGNSGATQAPSAGSTSKKPSTPAEVVAYFNTAVNKVKTSAKTVEQKSVTNYLAGQTTISSGIKSVYNMLGGDEWLDGMLKKNGQGAATYTGADIKAKFPVEGETWASKLTTNDVTSATCTENNGVYTIKIVTKADAKSDNIKHGDGHNPKAFNVILPGVVNDNIPGIAASLVGTASMNYPSSTATITVDAKTGNVLTANYDLKWTINFDKMGIILPFGTVSIYNVKW